MKSLYDRKWRKRRAQQLAAHPLCAFCMKLSGKVTPASVADHVERHGGDPIKFQGALQSLCKECHDINQRGRFCITPGCSTLTLRGDRCDRHREAEPEGTGLSPEQLRLQAARERLTRAKDAWTRLAVDVLRREPGAGERVALTLAELQSAQDALDLGTRR